MQKFNLAKLLSAKLTNTLFIFDNPTHSLCSKDVKLIKEKLVELKQANNTILLITYNEELTSIVDQTIKLEDQPVKIKHPVYKKLNIPTKLLTATHKKTKKTLTVKLSKLNLMRGSPENQKTKIAKDILKKNIDHFIRKKLIHSDYIFNGHTEIGSCLYLDSNHQTQTNRSDIATFLSIAPKLRDFFARLPSAKIAGLQPAHFSYNHRLGMCKTCRGLGVEKLYINNFEQSSKLCSQCKGLKLNKISNSITYKGLSFYEILSKPVYELKQLLIYEKSIQNSCRLLHDFNLSNLRLSTKLQALSSSENDLIYLIDLLKRKKRKSLIILDNITTSFDNATLNCFLQNIQKLTHQHHTILLIDQNPLFLQVKDHIIDGKDFFSS